MPTSFHRQHGPLDGDTLMRGTWYVLPTAFDDDGLLDLVGQRRLVESTLSWGVDGLTVMAIMSEAATLTDEERKIALDAIFSVVDGRVPVAVGCSGPTTSVVIRRMKAAAQLGARAAMISAPMLTSDLDSLPPFFEKVGVEGDLPVIVQDEPVATGTVMPVSTLLNCLSAADSAIVKLEDPPTPRKITRLVAARPDLSVFGGLGGVYALSELLRGACGTMTGFSFPEILAAVRAAIDEDRRKAAAGLFDHYLPLILFEGQPKIGLGIRKEILKRRGALPSNMTRGPARIDKPTSEDLDHVLERVGIKPGAAALEIPNG